MHKSKIKQFTLAVCLSLMPLAAFSAGLGKLNVSSGLGEPLKAEIELLSVSPEELSTLVVAIASEEAYNAQGISRLAIHNNIKVEVAKSSLGSPIIKIRSIQPIIDPYLDMLIQVDWASGRLQREYTVLLDPPSFNSVAETSMPAKINTPVVNNATPETTVSATTSAFEKPKKADKVKAPKRSRAEQNEAIATELNAESVTTQRGDTLSTIAKQMQVEGVSLDQMLMGLYENNKAAFAGNNMNRLKVGQIVRLPSKESLTSTTEKQASKLVRAQSANWSEYRNSLAGAITELPATDEVEQKQQTASGKIVTTEDKAAKPKSGPQDVVKLSAGEKDINKAVKGNNKEFEAKIVALQEETTASEKALKEAQDRTSALEKQIQDMQKLLALKSQNMAQVQKNAETQKNADEEAKVAALTSADAVVNVKELAKAAEVTPPADENNVPSEINAKVDDKNTTPAEPKISIPPEPVAQSEQSLLDTITGFVDLTILAAIAFLGLLGAGWMFLRNKRRKDLDSFERGILTSGGLRANTVFGNTTGSTSNSDTSFLTDFAQSADGSMIDTNDVDPIAEAEVYMAYGRDAQAEEILKDAITKEPKRYELHLKLLEMYASRKDISAFEAIAGELYTTLGSDDPTWAKVALIGSEMEPSNPLYDVSKVSTSITDQLSTQQLDSSDFDNVDLASDLDLDFSADTDEPEDANSAVMQSFSSAEKVEQEVSFDMGSLEMESNESPSLTDSSSQALSADNSMDFDLGDFGEKTEETVTMSEPDLNTTDTMDNLTAIDTPSEAIKDNNDALSLPAAEGIADSNEFSMDFELPTDYASAPEPLTVVEDVHFDLSTLEIPMTEELPAVVANTVDDFSFDLPITDDVLVVQNVTSFAVADAESSIPLANEFDLSSISLDLADATKDSNVLSSPSVASNDLVDTMASEDVDIKLDLVAAYIDMDDKEGARELLEEIINEGSAQQQIRAKQLMDSLA